MQMRVGDRVRLKHDIAPYPLGRIHAGAVGTVTEVNPLAAHGDPIAWVTMDERLPLIDTRENVLQVFRAADQSGEVTPEAFERVAD